MERELWSTLSRTISDLARTRRAGASFDHDNERIVRVYLWAALHDRPTSWACHAKHWSDRCRPSTLPSQPTMSRRLRTKAVIEFLHAIGRRLATNDRAMLFKIIDGKPLTVAPHSRDREATWGRGAGQKAKGYKLHAIWGGSSLPVAFEVRPLDVNEVRVARTLVAQLDGGGYLLADAAYDASELYDLAAERQHRMLAPRQRPNTGLGHQRHSPHRLEAIARLEADRYTRSGFTEALMRFRRRIETDFGNLAAFAAGLHHLPPWARGLRRVTQWVHAKLLINAARIRLIHA
jgi:hypothetical protein